MKEITAGGFDVAATGGDTNTDSGTRAPRPRPQLRQKHLCRVARGCWCRPHRWACKRLLQMANGRGSLDAPFQFPSWRLVNGYFTPRLV